MLLLERLNAARRTLLTGLLTAVAALALAGPAQADFGLAPGSFTMATPNAKAGAHSDVVTTYALKQSGPATPDGGTMKELAVDLPPGLVGNPRAVSTCDIAMVRSNPPSVCPLNTVVGFARTEIAFPAYGFGDTFTTLIYNIVPDKGEPAAFAFAVNFNTVRLDASVRSGSDYGIRISAKNVTERLYLLSGTVTFWGVPADHLGPGPFTDNNTALSFGGPSNELRKAFLSNPTSCDGTPSALASLISWQAPLDTLRYDSQLASLTDCGDVPFQPSMTVRPGNAEAGAPVGNAIDLAVPQASNPGGLATAHLRKTVVKLPPGVTVSPSAANGQQACSDAGIGIGSDAAPSCPDASKIGTVDITTPVLEDPLKGSVYLGEQRPDQLLRLFIVAEGGGVVVKLPGIATPDPVTGQLTVTFDNTPQLPFSLLHMVLDGGPQAPLTNPASCGTATTKWDLTSWSSSTPVAGTDAFEITGNCDAANRFAPVLDAGAVSPTAGASSPFVLNLTRPDGTQELSGLDLTLPAGLLGRIADVPQCPEAQAAAGSCDAASRVGGVTVGAGAGATPVYLPQPGRTPTAVYLAGPYKGAPFSLSIVVPAQAGPFDLGTVVVRAALFVDPLDSHVTVKADPLPTILKGIPLKLRDVRVAIDRDGFMVNPTSCAPAQVKGDLTSAGGMTAALVSRFQVGDCASLALKPSLALTLSGKGQTTDGKHPAISAKLTQAPGQANLKKVRVVLPLSLALDPDNANGLCEFVDGSKVVPTCPAASIVGSATARTPILNEPLTGPVYFVKNIRKDPKSGRDIKTLPKLVLPLVGQNGVRLTLTGTSAVVDDQLVTTFDEIPDAPVSSFELNINGGKGGILAVSDADICKATQIADQQIDGQSNKAADASVAIQTPSCPLKVISKKITKTSVTVQVGGLGAGKVTVAGKGIKKTSRTIANATVATITAKRTKAKAGKVTVTFDPTGPARARKTTK
ncbi:MAG TPA: hypothetical protein VFY45_19405 [Baekduia sp.]|nr:hypothetical protein [Baekduia sp.]